MSDLARLEMKLFAEASRKVSIHFKITLKFTPAQWKIFAHMEHEKRIIFKGEWRKMKFEKRGKTLVWIILTKPSLF